MTEVPDAETMKAFNKNIVDEFRANAGVVGGPFEGATPSIADLHRGQIGSAAVGAGSAYLTIEGKMYHHRLEGRCGHQSRLGAQPSGQLARAYRSRNRCLRRHRTRAATCRARRGSGRRSSGLRRASVTTRPTPAGSSRCSNSSGFNAEAREHRVVKGTRSVTLSAIGRRYVEPLDDGGVGHAAALASWSHALIYSSLSLISSLPFRIAESKRQFSG